MYSYLIYIFINICGAICATTGFRDVLHAIVSSVADEHYKCPHLRSSKYFNKDILKNCTNFELAHTLTEIDQSNIDSGLCILYYNNFISLCYETNNIDTPLEDYTHSNLDIKTVCDTLIHNTHFVNNAKPGIDAVNGILKEKCFAVCTDSWNVKNICKLSAHITRVTDEFIKNRDSEAKTIHAENIAQAQNRSGNTTQTNPQVQPSPIVYETPQEVVFSAQTLPQNPQVVPESAPIPDVEIPAAKSLNISPKQDLDSKKQVAHDRTISNDTAKPALNNSSSKIATNTETLPDSKTPILNTKNVGDQPAKLPTNGIPRERTVAKVEPTHTKDDVIIKQAPQLDADVNKPTFTSASPVKDVVDDFVEHPFIDKDEVNKPVEEEHAPGNPNDGQDEETIKDLKDENDIEFEGPLPGDYANDVAPKSSEVRSKAEIAKSTEKLKPLQTDDDRYTFAANYQNQNVDDSDSYFFSYFMMFCIIFVCAYVAYHNKQKILALIVEGRRGRRPSRSRRPNSANYRKLDSNLEEAVTSTCNKSAPQVIY